MNDILQSCTLCPRNCRVNRYVSKGYCGCNDKIKIARAALHYWEEPCINGANGSGAVFFSGCQLRCCFCQNRKISSENFGKKISVKHLAEIFLKLQNQNANNINLVSATQYVPQIIEALGSVKEKLKIPVIFNSGGYESIDTIRMLDGYVDVYLPDLKYYDSIIAKNYSKAPDYFSVASQAIKEMFRQTGKIKLNDKGIIEKGVIIRHLVLPGCRHDSIKIMDWIADNFCTDDILVSAMSQYTPYYNIEDYKDLNRKVSTFEYNSVMQVINKRNIKGYMQEKTSAKEEYTPDFDLTGV